MPACLDSFRSLFPLQPISDELPLIRRRPFAATEWAQEHETVPDEHWADNLRDVLERQPELHMVLPRSVASAVIEHDRGKRTATRGPPQESLQSKTITQNLDSLRSWRLNDLRDSRAGNCQCDCQQEQWSHRTSYGSPY
jgi:hypothetical protein